MGPFSRIFLRYLIGYLLAKGIIPDELANEISNDPEVVAWIENGVSLMLAALIERWYWFAKKAGWKT